MSVSWKAALTIATCLVGQGLGAVRVPGAYIFEFADGHDSSYLASAIKKYGGKVTREMNFKSFKSVAVTFETSRSDDIDNSLDSIVDGLAKHPSIQIHWPIHSSEVVHEKPLQTAPLGTSFVSPMKEEESTSSSFSSNGNSQSVPFPMHVMTQVDKLHEWGITGKGIKVAIIDSGVDHTHPALGGCIGPGCLIENAYNFNIDKCAGSADNVTDCNFHGTMVAGLIAAQKNPLGFIGAAPGAKLAIYRLNSYEDDRVIASIYRAAIDGASVINMSFGQDGNPFMEHPVSRAITRVTESGVACLVAQGNSGIDGQFFGSGPPDARGAAGVGNINTEPSAELITANNQTTIKYVSTPKDGGALSVTTTWGPTMDMDVKPQFSAPGDRGVSLMPVRMGSYMISGGTSSASPLTAAIYALLAEAYGGEMQPKLFAELLSANANPQLFNDGTKFFPSRLAPVPQQGAGLVRAYNAIFATSSISPASLSFNDSDAFASSLEFTISNRLIAVPINRNAAAVSNEDVTYTISNVPSMTMYTLDQNATKALQFPLESVDATATLTFSHTSVTIPKGQSTKIQVSAAVPQMNTKRLPVWSGYITVNGSDGSALSIPYQGLAGSLRKTVVLLPGGTSISRNPPSEKSPKGQSNKRAAIVKATETDAVDSVEAAPRSTSPKTTITPPLFLNGVLQFASPLIEVFIVPVVPRSPGSSESDESDSDTAAKLWDTPAESPSAAREIGSSPFHWVARGGFTVTTLRDQGGFFWDGRLKAGKSTPEGTYRFITRALRNRGTPGNRDDYDMSISPSFGIKYV